LVTYDTGEDTSSETLERITDIQQKLRDMEELKSQLQIPSNLITSIQYNHNQVIELNKSTNTTGKQILSLWLLSENNETTINTISYQLRLNPNISFKNVIDRVHIKHGSLLKTLAVGESSNELDVEFNNLDLVIPRNSHVPVELTFDFKKGSEFLADGQVINLAVEQITLSGLDSNGVLLTKNESIETPFTMKLRLGSS